MKNNESNKITEAMNFSSTEFLPEGGVKVEVQNELIDLFTKGDDRCSLKVGDRIKKKVYEPGDIHKQGHKGIVIGSLFTDNFPEKYQEGYIVQFEGDDAICMTVGYKIELL